jgi:hypothetical protein
MKLLTCEEFKKQVFARDKHRCVFCDNQPTNAHHILESRLFPDGGHYLNNGASVCDEHHTECELTKIDVQTVRDACDITDPVLPPGFFAELVYDKWGNQIINNMILRGQLFDDVECKKMLTKAGKLQLVIG